MHDGSARSELFGDRNGAGRGAGAGYSQSERAAEASRDLMEAENNRMLSELGDKVSMLKQVTVDINSDVRRQNRELDGMSSDFDRAGDLLGSAMGNVKKLLNSGGQRYMCYLILFVVFVFLVLYWLISKR